MNLYKSFLFSGLLLLSWETGAQRLQGTVRDADTGARLAGVSISLGQTPDVDALAIITDEFGVFYTDALRPGHYLCFFTLKDYEPVLIPEVHIVSGKETVLDVTMRQSSDTLPDVTIMAAAPDRRSLQPLGEIPLTREQTRRFPATFFDPARLALAYPGVANTDDQANGLTIRGNGPASVRWRLEGVDITNPNHLPNAGTLGDRPTTSSGGVLMFSAQLLDNSSLLTGAFPAGYGDALGGIMDISWRRGNNERHEFTTQAGLIGLDLAAEGPLGKKHRHSYLVNYRYSTVGLLGLMGISFGGEKISFQDLSFKTDFAGKKDGHWSVFGAVGLSENVFTPPADSADVKEYKDLFHIRFRSGTGILGASQWSPLGRNTLLKTTLVASVQRNDRHSSGANRVDEDDNTESRIGLSTTLTHRLNAHSRLQAGIQAQQMIFDLDATQNNGIRHYYGYAEFLSMQPWASWNVESAGGRSSLNLGVHSLILYAKGDNKHIFEALPEPRISANIRLGGQHRLSFALGMHSQLHPLWFYATELSNYLPDDDHFQGSKLARSYQVALRHSWNKGDTWVFKTELFYQWLYNIPVSAETRDALSLLNIGEVQTFAPLKATGTGENKGIELSAERYLTGGWFLLANTTLFDARYRGSDGQWRSSRWNLRHIANLTAGKEWQRDRWPERTRAFGVNGRLTWAGGQYAAPLDIAASEAAQTTVYDFSNGYVRQQQGFVRLDLRVYWRRNTGERRNSTFAMDFQNVSIRKNVAYQYYDPYTGRVETKEQLGLVPNLSWRLEF